MHDDFTMMAWWRVTCYTNLNICANNQKPEIICIQIWIHALIVMKQNPKSLVLVMMKHNRNNLHRIDVTTITHNIHCAIAHNVHCAHTKSQCKTSTNTHQHIKEKINHLNTLKYKKWNEKHKCIRTLRFKNFLNVQRFGCNSQVKSAKLKTLASNNFETHNFNLRLVIMLLIMIHYSMAHR
jgi:hypothetical protein